MKNDLVRMDLFRIIINEHSDSQIIVLAEHENPERTFVIVIGFFEAAAIDRKVKNIRTPRPMTHDLVHNVIGALGGRLKTVVISDLRDSTFYAKLLIERNGDLVEVDARPSDAIALAVDRNAEIYCARQVLDAAGSET